MKQMFTGIIACALAASVIFSIAGKATEACCCMLVAIFLQGERHEA
jgi:hypothetical protein